jgi:hypothetical protein
MRMNKIVSPEIKEVMGAVHYRPSISIIMPFEPKMRMKAELIHALEMAVEKVERELLENYPEEMEVMMIQKLRTVIKNLNFNTHKKSIAIFLSPVFEKILYLDIDVEEKIIIDESFEIRDLVYSRKQLHKYLVLQLTANSNRIYIGNSETFIRLVSNKPEMPIADNYDIAEQVANFSNSQQRREIMMDKFLHYADNTLDIILQSYRLPLFIMGNDRVLGHFKKISRHNGMVIEYIQSDHDDISFQDIKKILNPYVSDWKRTMQKDVLNKLDEAAGKQKLVSGMRDVWREASARKGRLLVVEKSFMYAAERGSSDEIIYKAIEPYNKFSYIRDAVDDVMEKVLENGGDVEFVDEGLLKDRQHIALILFY